jgi:hypothetical protein
MAPSVVATEPASITPIPLSMLPHADTSLVLQIEADRIARASSETVPLSHSEALQHKSGFVILKPVTIGICDQCGNRYYTAEVLQRVHAIATGKIKAERTQRVPVARAG